MTNTTEKSVDTAQGEVCPTLGNSTVPGQLCWPSPTPPRGLGAPPGAPAATGPAGGALVTVLSAGCLSFSGKSRCAFGWSPASPFCAGGFVSSLRN